MTTAPYRPADAMPDDPGCANPLTHCGDCGQELTADERFYYGSTCHLCEGLFMGAPGQTRTHFDVQGGARNDFAQWWPTPPGYRAGTSWFLCPCDQSVACGPAIVDDFGDLVMVGWGNT